MRNVVAGYRRILCKGSCLFNNVSIFSCVLITLTLSLNGFGELSAILSVNLVVMSVFILSELGLNSSWLRR